MYPIFINIKNKNVDPIIIKIKKCDTIMKEGSDNDVLVCEKCPETLEFVLSAPMLRFWFWF